MKFNQWLYAPGKDRPIYLMLIPSGILLVFSLAMLLAGGCRAPFPAAVATPDEAPALTSTCPCPEFAHPWHPGAGTEDPDHPGECATRSRTGRRMDAREHPACWREVLERAGVGR